MLLSQQEPVYKLSQQIAGEHSIWQLDFQDKAFPSGISEDQARTKSRVNIGLKLVRWSETQLHVNEILLHVSWMFK